MTSAERTLLQELLDNPGNRLRDSPATWDALRTALGTCGTCAHADTSSASESFCFCAAPFYRNVENKYPFSYQRMPLNERCNGWTAKET